MSSENTFDPLLPEPRSEDDSSEDSSERDFRDEEGGEFDPRSLASSRIILNPGHQVRPGVPFFNTSGERDGTGVEQKELI